MRRIIRTAAVLAVLGSIVFSAGVVAFVHKTLQVPRRVGPGPNNAITVSLTARDGVKLSAWWLRPAESNGNCVAVLHGIGDSRVGTRGFAPMFLDRGYSVLLPDSRAHGVSGGEFVTYGLLERYDVVDWAAWMKSAGCRRIYGLGESLGASILIQAAGIQPAFDAIVAECPYADLREVAEYRIRTMGHVPGFVAEAVVWSAMVYAASVDGLDLRHVSPADSIAEASTPILLIHGLRDWRTPPYNSERLQRANPRDELWLVPGAFHTGASVQVPEEFRARVLGWFSAH